MAFLKEYGIEPAVIYDSQLAYGYDYNELGCFFADGSGNPYNDNDMRVFPEATEEAVTAEIIGGADGATAIIVENG